jgi:S1-C subfamily serine protease
MKLYSRGQVVFFTSATLLLAGLFAVGFGLIRLPSGSQAPEPTDALAVSEDSGFRLQTNPIPVEDIPSLSPSSGYSEDELENIRVYERLNGAVVNITTETVSYNWFLEPVPQEGSSGSGSIIDKRGYVLTNKHVVEKAYRVYITLADGSQYEGEVIGVDNENDLAVLKFDPGGKDLVTIPMGTSSTLKVGQKVLAIGNPFGWERTLTTGIVSGLGRPLRTSDGIVIHDMIQTDSSINPGNSGGPLLNAKGQMIGINTMIWSPTGASVGIGFAVPVDTARRVVPDLIQYGTVKRGWIDMVPVQLFPALVKYAELPVNTGLLISRLVEGGNAEQAGLRGGSPSRAVRWYGGSVIYLGGDIVTEVDGMAVATLADLFSALEDNKPGQIVTVKAYRGRQEKTFSVKLSDRPDNISWE